MPQVKLYNQIGDETGTLELNQKIFGIEKVKPEIVHQVVTALLAGKRNTVASTKTRAEVRGGGKKPWQQKGTGRARAGSIRSPLWRGGGITFGPTANRNYEKKLNRKVKTLGLFSVLTDKLKGQKLFVLENFDVTEPKTREVAKKITELSGKLSGFGRKVLVVTATKNENLVTAAKNMPNVKVTMAGNLNILDLLASDTLIILKDAFPIIEKTYLKTN